MPRSWATAVRSQRVTGRAASACGLALADEGDTRHLRTLNAVLAPQGPVQRSDFEIRFPAKTRASRERILAEGHRLEKLTVGVYIDGVTNAADPVPVRRWPGC